MTVAYRPAREDDLATADSLVVAAINDLTIRHGFGPMAAASSPNFQMFSLMDDPDGLWVAESESRDLLGFAWSWVCDDVWFLAQLFVDPAQQACGIGNELLKRTLEHAHRSNAAHRALITFAFNRVSQGLYVKHGLFPKMPIYLFVGDQDRVMAGLPEPSLRSNVVDESSVNLKVLSDIDIQALGVTREKHHRYLLTDPTMKGVLFKAGSECVGYSYVSAAGHVGPLAVSRADVLGDAFVAALKIAAAGSSPKISVFLPGTCENALSLAIAAGMRITFPMLLMASPGFGSWTKYLPRNPGFM